VSDYNHRTAQRNAHRFPSSNGVLCVVFLDKPVRRHGTNDVPWMLQHVKFLDKLDDSVRVGRPLGPPARDTVHRLVELLGVHLVDFGRDW
jgi:hypothetical protein